MKSIQKQKAVYLIEALISMLLMAIMVMGLDFVSSKMMNAKTEAKIHGEVVEKLRNVLLSDSDAILCDGDSKFIQVGSSRVLYTVSGCDETISTTIAGKTFPVPVPKLLETQYADRANFSVGVNGLFITGGG